jgi:poly-gamma-glutamate synthesis protein (capsule biosynthesis protein)
VHFEKMIRTELDADPATVMAPVSGLLGGADLAVVNLETAVTTRGTPAPKAFTFRAPDTAFDALRAAGVDAVTMANNHGMDFGTVGLDDSLAAAEAKAFPVVGIGRDEDQAFAPWITEVKGQRIALIGATQVLDSNLLTAWTATETQGGLASAKRVDRLLEAVRSARTEADTVVVVLHWGTEKQTCPNERQRELAPQLVEAGADVVVGSHAHRVLGGGMMGDAVVHYGLGNFVFYTPGGPGTDSGVFTVSATGRRIEGYDWAPAQIQGGVPIPLEGAAAAAAEASWEALRDCTGLTP